MTLKKKVQDMQEYIIAKSSKFNELYTRILSVKCSVPVVKVQSYSRLALFCIKNTPSNLHVQTLLS